MIELESLLCDAGRRATYNGRWTLPCFNQPARNLLAFSQDIGGDRQDGTPIMRFCDKHMEQLVLDGLINEALIDDDDWDRRVLGEEP